MDSVQPVFTGTAAQAPAAGAQGPIKPATSGLFGSGGQFQSASVMRVGSALATGFGAYGQIQSGQQMKAQYDMQAGSYATQAELTKVNATEQANMLRKQLLQDLGSANASAAARGIDIGSGTPLQIQQESIGNVGLDIQKLESGATISSTGSKTSAARSAAAGAAAAQGGYYKAAQSIGSYALK